MIKTDHEQTLQVAFTLLELIITVIILTILAGFAIQGFQRTIQGTREKEVRINLIAIKTAQMIYFSQNGQYYSAADIAHINTGLNLAITPSDPINFFYACTTTLAPPAYTCTAGYGIWSYAIDQNMDIPACQTLGACVP
ncbi:MAG: hypothetical protein NT079_02215 [Candidatus Omnitrophica bacterium]|nr:hypothetical protein [Candidatus Omnitrophota bacterium]